MNKLCPISEWEKTAQLKAFHREPGIAIYNCFYQEILHLLPRALDVAIICDPPYGIKYKLGKNRTGLGKHNRQNSNMPVIGDEKPFDPREWLAWTNMLMFGADHCLHRLPSGGRLLGWDKLDGRESWDSFADAEFAWHSCKGKPEIIRYLWKGICQAGEKDKGRNGREHPTQKPVAVMRWLIEKAREAMPVSLIIDPFCGTGPTLQAARELGIPCIGVECVKAYCTVAARKLQQGVLAI